MRFLLILLLTLFSTIDIAAAEEKIDPKTYICAELIASSVDGQPPIFETLQIDGYAAALAGQPVADASIMETLLLNVYDSCSATPTDTALSHWQEARKHIIIEDDGPWRADKTTCREYEANPDDGSGFVIWLDAYQRGKADNSISIFTDQNTLDQFLAACKANPDKLMLDIIKEKGK